MVAVHYSHDPMQLRNRPTHTVALQQIAAVEQDMNNNTQGQTDRNNASADTRQAAQQGQTDGNELGGEQKQDGTPGQQEQKQDGQPSGPQKSGQEQKSDQGRDTRR
jgi:hypothetical protein